VLCIFSPSPRWGEGRGEVRGEAALGAGSVGDTPQGAPNGDAVTSFYKAMGNFPAPQIRDDVVEHVLLLGQPIADGQRAITRRLRGSGIQQVCFFHGMMS
jgi:hypothetical protein